MNYNKHLKDKARELRKNGTPGEVILWKHVLRAKNPLGLQFNRQFIIENYIVDFVCRKLKLVIELDGQYHRHFQEEDSQRDQRLNELGYKVLRIAESDVVNDTNSVYHYLQKFIRNEYQEQIDQISDQSPSPSR